MTTELVVSMAMLLSENNRSFLPTTKTPLHNATEWILVQSIIPPYIFTLCVTGLLGNGFVLLVFLLQREQCSVPEIYLGNLALADLLLLACLPFWAMNILNDYNWPYGDFLCYVVNLSITVNFYTSIYLLVMVSVDRYLALVRTMRARWLRRKRYARAICLILWLFGLLIGGLASLHRKVTFIEEYRTMACILEYPDHSGESWKLAHNLLLNIVGFVVPVVGIFSCSCNIIRALRKRRQSVYIEGGNDRKATVLVYAVTLLFFVCWSPFQLFTLLDMLCDAEVLDETWHYTLDIGTQFSTYLAILNSSLNPLLYVFSGQYFRRKVSTIYKRTKNRRRSDTMAFQLSIVSTYLHRTDQIKPVVIQT
ncbi:B1 bradykinin receptor-like [Oncorhynchus clarkii lewisi]|uniref:B1 bradykinin receptor-like n=1 Tax=Oncorhynchus clarkii lewisi TaxID=490388 RepID=UPI0039B8FEE6